MVEGRISAGVVVGDGSDVGGGASIMGTLSGGGKRGRLDRPTMPARRQRRNRHLARRRLRGRGRLLRHRRHQGHPRPTAAWSRHASCPAQSGWLFWQNSVTGAMEAVRREGAGIALNEALHSQCVPACDDAHRDRRGARPRRRRSPWATYAVPGRRRAAARPRGLHRDGRRPHGLPVDRAGRERRPDRRGGRASRAAGPGRVHRARDGVPGVQAREHRVRRQRLARAVPAAAEPGVGHRAAGHRSRTTPRTRSSTRWSRSPATRHGHHRGGAGGAALGASPTPTATTSRTGASSPAR